MGKRAREDKLDEAVRLAAENNMTYAEFQAKESLGLVKIKNGRLLRAGVDYQEVRDEHNGGNTQRQL